MDNGLCRRKDANEPSSSQPRCHSNSRRGSDSISSTPEGYMHENFTMGIKGPYEESLLDQKMFDLLEARYLFIYLSL